MTINLNMFFFLSFCTGSSGTSNHSKCDHVCHSDSDILPETSGKCHGSDSSRVRVSVISPRKQVDQEAKGDTDENWFVLTDISVD